MKKICLMLFLACLLTGCSAAPAAPTEVSETRKPALTSEEKLTEVTAESTASSLEETMSASETTAVPEESLSLSYDAYQVAYYIMTENGEESGTFQGIGPDGDLLWTYETDHFPMAQMSRISPLGKHQGIYYLVEDGTVVGLNVENGQVLFRNSDFMGSPAEKAFAIDEYGFLYLSGFDTPDLFVMDLQGHTVKKFSSVSDQFYGPFEITLDGNQVIVHMESDGRGGSGDFPVSVERDWIPQPKG